MAHNNNSLEEGPLGSHTGTNGANSAQNQPQVVVQTDVFIAGSGPTGATYARKLVDAGISVYMVDIGAQETAIPGDHKKNNYVVQKDINNFISVVQGELDLLSVPTDNQADPSLDPSSWSIDPHKGTIHNGQNPYQDAYVNLPAAAATRTVGGMGTHWTCCTPRQHPVLERSDLFSDAEWDRLYTEAESRIKTNHTIFDSSIRQQLVKRTLREGKYGNGPREFISMPLAVEEIPDQSWLDWSCSKTVFGPIARGPDQPGNKLFTLKSQTRCTKLARDIPNSKAINAAECKDLKTGKTFLVKAKKYIVCAGAILTPGILYKSGWTPATRELPALGCYLTEQVMAFCQVILKRSLIEEVYCDPSWKARVAKHKQRFPNDPLPFPFNDPDPQVYTPVSEAYPWHTQIHRDAFSYGAVPATVDQRTIVDLRWFGAVTPVHSNRVTFTDSMKDQFGMPQPTFNYSVPPADAERCHRMMADMCVVASQLGGFLPGAEPKFLPAGSALHISGTTRAGKSLEDSVCDKFGKVWGTDDLYVGGCSVIPTGAACNPTLTAMCFAIAGADSIIVEMGKHPAKTVA